MRTSIIIHGHFYQPPRENPSTGLVPKQIHGERWSDWNEKIDASCYRANCRSRYLGPYGKIRSINNNYLGLSWNFGPTLLAWLERDDPFTLGCLRAADKESLARLGHGNAMAQGYSHSILPLDNLRDRRLQIAWGIEDFRRRFGREPEGFWCPECAINADVIDDLSDAGIRFVVLSPWQARAVEDGDGRMVPLEGRPAPFDRPYRIFGRRGSLAAFFYESGMASAVSFGHILRDADAFYARLLELRRENDDPPLIHWATDGEIYGHHEPFGDMALAALIRKIEEGDDFELTNYGAYLQSHPAVRRAELLDGDDGLGTSWSCSHGVARWFRDCGCSTGGKRGWNQKWRTPLREALSALEESLFGAYERTVSAIIGGPSPAEAAFGLLEGYGKVASGALDAARYLRPLGLGEEDRIRVARLLLGMRQILCAFASCGWFFNDLAGTEPRQSLAFAMDAIRLFGDSLPSGVEAAFLQTLSKARSNVPAYKTGREMALYAKEALPGEAEAAMAVHLSSRINPKAPPRRYGFFRVLPAAGPGALRLVNTLTTETSVWTVRAELSENRIEASSGAAAVSCLFYELPDRLKDSLVLAIDDAVCVHSKSLVSEIGNSIMMLGLLSRKFSNPLHDSDYALAFRALKQFFNAPLEKVLEAWPPKEAAVATIASQIALHAPALTREFLNRLLSGCLDRAARKIVREGPTDGWVGFALRLLRLSRGAGIEPDTTSLQDAVYPRLGKEASSLVRTLAVELNFEL